MNKILSICGLLFCATTLNSCLGTSSTACNLTSIFCSCDLQDLDESPKCTDYEGAEPSNAQSSCEELEGTFSNTALCSTEYRLGTCKKTLATYSEWDRYYVAGFGDAITAAAACEILHIQYLVMPGASFDWISN